VIVLDASVLIGYLDELDAHHPAARALMSAAIDDDLAVNTLTLAEILVVPVAQGTLETILAVLRDLDVKELGFPPDAAIQLARLRSTTGLRMPDCAVLLSAQAAGASIASFDDRLTSVAGQLAVPVFG
jgi:predicted nucleic acid-binding protein